MYRIYSSRILYRGGTGVAAENVYALDTSNISINTEFEYLIFLN